jgi:serine phosphatase RsbU (regulator of sigma subunit)
MSYWRIMPLGRMKKLLAAAFFTVSVLGFVLDLLLLNRPHLGRGLVWPLLMGAGAAGTLAARIKRRDLYPYIQLTLVVVCCLAFILPYASIRLPVPDALKQRVAFDAIAIFVCTMLSYRLLQSFLSHEGLASIRMQTELSLAHGIQATLVPTVSFQNASFEVYGKSIPSTEMGGDLIDVIKSDGSLLAYVADVSGHGLAAGQLMGMLKTAMRLAVQFRQPPVALLESADRVLPDLKEPDMYATLALLQFDGSAEVEYALAGHVPILHYRDRSRDTARLSMEQFPLGLIPGGCYASQRVTYSSRDLFLMLTDGISEVPNDRDEEFGLARLAQLLSQYAEQPLPQIWELIMKEVRQHGVQQDDQTLLLVRVRQ